MSTFDERDTADQESAPTVGAADADADALRAGADDTREAGDLVPDGDIETARADDSNLADEDQVDTDGVPVGAADADEDARRARGD